MALKAPPPSFSTKSAQSQQSIQKGPRSAYDASDKLTIITGASTGEGISYLPFTIMKVKELVEKQGQARGISIKAEYQRFPKPIPMREDLISGKIDFAAGGVTQLLATWDLTRRTEDPIKGVVALNSMPLTLVTSNTKLHSIFDFDTNDKIAVPAVRTSIQAVVLAMACEKMFGKGQAAKLETLTTAMSHPDAVKALTNGNSDVNSHISSAPFLHEELENHNIRKIFDSYEVLEGSHTYNAVWTSTKFYKNKPKVVEAYAAAIREAHEIIKSDPSAAAKIWLETENAHDLTLKQIEAIIRDPQNEWTTTPKKFTYFARFMKQNGLLSGQPAGLSDVFFTGSDVEDGD